MLSFAQISDCHIGKELNNKNLVKVINEINNLKIKTLVISGDLTENGLLSEYLQLQNILGVLNGVDIFVIAGNHDNNLNLAKVFSQKQMSNFVLENYNIQLINSKIENEVFGNISPDDINSTLENSILITHHPVINMDSNWDDDLSINNKNEFLQQISLNKNIKMICFGHCHEAKTFKVGEINIYSCPSSAYQFDDKNGIGFNVYELGTSIKKTTIWL